MYKYFSLITIVIQLLYSNKAYAFVCKKSDVGDAIICIQSSPDESMPSGPSVWSATEDPYNYKESPPIIIP